MVQLEDLEGAIDVLLFPSSYQLAAPLLEQDAILTVRGRLSRSKEQPELHGQEVSAPALDRANGDGPVVISMPITRCTPKTVAGLKNVLFANPGLTEVPLRL